MSGTFIVFEREMKICSMSMFSDEGRLAPSLQGKQLLFLAFLQSSFLNDQSTFEEAV